MELDLKDIAYRPTTGVRRVYETPLVVASEENLKGYGCLVEEPEGFPIEIVRWPAQGWRPIDLNSGDQGGVTEGLFEFAWAGDTLFARNHAVGDSYLFGWSLWPEEARIAGAPAPRQQALIWRANYHPDGGQLFYPIHPAVHRTARPARRRCEAGGFRRLPLRRRVRALHPPEYLARRRRAACRPCRTA